MATLANGGAQKKEGWEKEDESADLFRKAKQQKARREQLLLGALTHKPDLAEAHLALAEHYKQAHSEAEQSDQPDNVWRIEQHLSQHIAALPTQHPNRAAMSAYLKGDGTLYLETQPTGAIVKIAKYARIARRLQPIDE